MGISMVVFPTEPSFDAEPASGMEAGSSGLAARMRSAALLSAEIGKLPGNFKKPESGQGGTPNSGREDSPNPTAGTTPTPLPTPTLTPENNSLTAEVPQEIEELIRTYFTITRMWMKSLPKSVSSILSGITIFSAVPRGARGRLTMCFMF